ncbi:hypothetical protein HMPREF9431_01003 [Segatella oulorum F0390]|uniref:Uncharacterized protein n=1 Tax=Segatella oulorum F0390 TaxID=702438 RepID=G1WB02_9BACT|nr:hypothetical protein HMPREF9431_01003 [Segatella oulorum F0390]
MAVSNGAHFVFIESICKRLDSETELLKNEYFKKAADTLKGAFNEENRYFALSKKSASTDEILAADADRDTLYSAYYRSVKSFLRVSSADLHTAAKTLWQSLVDYGIKPSMQLERETGAIQNLLADCEQKYSAEVAKLGLQTVLASLKTANAKVSELLYSRTTEQLKQVAGALRKARQQSDEAFKQVRKVANAMATLGSAEALKPFADFVNQLIKRYEDEVLPKKRKRMIRSRMAVKTSRAARNLVTAGKRLMARSRATVTMARINRAEKVRAMPQSHQRNSLL